jgi:hypothetical protein
MSHRIKPSTSSRPRHSAPILAVQHREQQQGSQLAALAAATGAGKIGYGALAFWLVVAVLVAARVAFLDPTKIDSTSSLLGTKATSAWNTGESRSPRN